MNYGELLYYFRHKKKDSGLAIFWRFVELSLPIWKDYMQTKSPKHFHQLADLAKAFLIIISDLDTEIYSKQLAIRSPKWKDANTNSSASRNPYSSGWEIQHIQQQEKKIKQKIQGILKTHSGLFWNGIFPLGLGNSTDLSYKFMGCDKSVQRKIVVDQYKQKILAHHPSFESDPTRKKIKVLLYKELNSGIWHLYTNGSSKAEYFYARSMDLMNAPEKWLKLFHSNVRATSLWTKIKYYFKGFR